MYLKYDGLEQYADRIKKAELEEEDWVVYTGYYYSFLHHGVKPYKL